MKELLEVGWRAFPTYVRCLVKVFAYIVISQLTIRPASADAVRAALFFHVIVHYADINQFMCH